MPFDLDTTRDLAGAAIITLAGREWFIPPLAVRQSRVVLPLLIRLMPALAELQERPDALGEAEWGDLVRVVHVALTRAYPSLTLDEILDLPAPLSEFAAAIAVITRQTGMFVPAEKNAGEANGETASLSTAPLDNSTS